MRPPNSRCDLARERLYLWEHLYPPGGETVTCGSYVSLFTVNSKSNKNKPQIICFMKLWKQHCLHPSSKIILWQEKHAIGFNSNKCSEHVLFYFSLIFHGSFCIPVLGWKDNSVRCDGPLKIHNVKEVSAQVFKWAKPFLREHTYEIDPVGIRY